MKNIKYTEEYIKGVCNDKALEYLKIETLNDKGKSRRMIYFICNNHKEKGVQIRPVEKVISNKKPCQYCNHYKLKDTFKDEIKLINPNIIILSDYKNWDTKIKCKCTIDGNEWYSQPSVLLYGGGCPVCGNIKKAESRRKTKSEFERQMLSVNKDIKILGEYKNTHSLIKCKCLIDGCEWESYPANLLNKSAGCPECAKKRMCELESLSNDQFIERLKNINKNIIPLDTYINTTTKIRFKCKIHDCIFETSPRNFLYKGGRGCPYCNQSLGEKKMIMLLEQFGFNISKQHTFDDCKNISKLRFDGYDKNNKIAYEYQGQQHYKPVDFAGKGQDWALEQYNMGKKRDVIKQKYCINNNIQLIEVPYWEYDNMENFLRDKIFKYIK